MRGTKERLKIATLTANVPATLATRPATKQHMGQQPLCLLTRNQSSTANPGKTYVTKLAAPWEPKVPVMVTRTAWIRDIKSAAPNFPVMAVPRTRNIMKKQIGRAHV